MRITNAYIKVRYFWNDDDWTTKMVIGRQQISFKLDTGAQTNVLPMKIFETLTPTCYS